jgi:drug/metabolite transporter (DMT)-like permease
MSTEKMKSAPTAIPLVFENAYLQIHFCVLLWGFTAILGKLISLAAIPLVFWRLLIVSLCLLFWPPVWRRLAGVCRRDLAVSMGAGVLITLHWLSFYGAIKLSNASVGVASIALAPMFLSFVEPYLLRQPFVNREVLLALASIPGVILVVGGIPSGMLAGFGLGILSALFVAIFSLVNKRLTMRVPALALTAIEIGTGVVLLGALIPAWPSLGVAFALPGREDLAWLLILSVGCTLLPFALSMVALRKISAFSAQLAVNMEPVYAIVIATTLLGESKQLQWPFYLGVVLILGSVLINARQHRPGGPP